MSGSNGQGHTKDEARESLAAAIDLILNDQREDALRGLPKDAEQGTVHSEIPNRLAAKILRNLSVPKIGG